MLATQTEYAKHRGVSGPRVTQWKHEGRLVFSGSKVDVEASDARLDGHEDDEHQVDTPSLEEFLNGLLKGQFGTQHAAERVKENALAGLRTLELRRKAGALVDLETAQTVLFESARTFRDALLNWPIQAAPLIAADLNVPAETVTEVLVTHVRNLLAGLGEPDASGLIDRED